MIQPTVEAARLAGAFAARQMVETPSSLDPAFDLGAAYAVEAAIAQAHVSGGHQAVGWKVGYANKAMWPALDLETLVWAHVYDDTVRYADWNDATLSMASMVSPKIEPAIVFKLAKTLSSSDAAGVLEATEWYALSFEIIDCVFPGWTFQPADFVAARGLHAALIIGEPVFVEPAGITRLVSELSEFTIRLLRNNELVEEGAAANALESPALCVGELGEARRRRGGGALQAGDLITTGTLTASLPIAAGDTWIASLSGIPPSSLTLRIR